MRGSVSLRYGGVVLLLLVFLCAGIYWGALEGGTGFFHDDMHGIVGNSPLHIEEWSLPSLLWAMKSGDYIGPLGRPLSMFSFALHYYFDKSEAFHFKLVNLLLHLANGGLVFWLGSLLFRFSPLFRPVPWSGSWPAPPYAGIAPVGLFTIFLATAFWLLAPVNVTSVVYIVQRMNLLAAGFCLFGMCCYCLGRIRLRAGLGGLPWILLGFFALFPAAFCKENGAILPLFLFLLEAFFFRFEAAAADRRKLQILFTCFLYVPVILGVSVLIGWPSLLLDGYQLRDFSPLERLFTEARVLAHDLRLLLLPSPAAFTMFQDIFSPSRGLLTPPSTLVAVLLLTAVFGVALYCVRRAPLLSFAILFFFAGHMVESTIVPLELFYDHRNYLPGLGIFLALGYYLARFCERLTPRKKIFTQALVCLLLLGYASCAKFWADRWGMNPVEAALYEVRGFDSARANLSASYAAYVYYQLLQKEPDAISHEGNRKELLSKHKDLAIDYAGRAVEWRSDSWRISPQAWRIVLHHALHLPVRKEWVEALGRTLATRRLHPVAVGSLRKLFMCHGFEEEVDSVARAGRERGPQQQTSRGKGTETGASATRNCALSEEQMENLWQAVLANHRLIPAMRAVLIADFSLHLWSQPGRKQQAYDLAREASRRYPENEPLQVVLVRMRYESGDYQGAIRDLLEYDRRYPGNFTLLELEQFVESLEKLVQPLFWEKAAPDGSPLGSFLESSLELPLESPLESSANEPDLPVLAADTPLCIGRVPKRVQKVSCVLGSAPPALVERGIRKACIPRPYRLGDAKVASNSVPPVALLVNNAYSCRPARCHERS